LLNHRDREMEIAQNFSIPRWMNIDQFGDRPGWGEDGPVWYSRLLRDGWKLICSPEKTKDDYGAKVWIEYDPPFVWQKPHPVKPDNNTLQMSILGIKETDGPWYLTEHSVVGRDGSVTTIGRSEWADWSQTGDLLFSQSGCLYRLGYKKGALGPIEASEQIADFSDLRFQPCEAPDDVLQWPRR